MTDYPYMYARVSAKRAKLLDSNDYEKLLKMQPNEIARQLEEGDYGEEINELGAKYDGVELVELALDKNLSRTLSHINKIAPRSLKKVINVYLRRYDLRSIKRLLRWKKSGQENNIEDLLSPAAGFNMETLKQLAEQDFEEITDSIIFTDSEINYQDYLQDKTTLSEIEKALDQAYHEELRILSGQVKSTQFSNFLQDELEFENLRTILRLKKYDIESEKIDQFISNRQSTPTIEKARNAESLEKAMEIVKEKQDLDSEISRLEDLEHAMEVKRLENALRMLHTEPLGATSILGYIVAKIIENKNLRMLIRAKETGIQNLETIRRNLVMA